MCEHQRYTNILIHTITAAAATKKCEYMLYNIDITKNRFKMSFDIRQVEKMMIKCWNKKKLQEK